MTVLQLCRSESFNKYVKIERRYGICDFLFANALITSPNDDNDELIAMASLNTPPVDPLVLLRSEPAKSIRFRVELVFAPI